MGTARFGTAQGLAAPLLVSAVIPRVAAGPSPHSPAPFEEAHRRRIQSHAQSPVPSQTRARPLQHLHASLLRPDTTSLLTAVVFPTPFSLLDCPHKPGKSSAFLGGGFAPRPTKHTHRVS